MGKMTVEDLSIKDRTILMRVDFNVPIENGKVANDKRIRAAMPTIRYILEKGGRLVLMSHLGRPKGKRVPGMSLKPCAAALGHLIHRDVRFIDDCIGEAVEKAVSKLLPGQVLLLENLRFYREETENDAAFARKLAGLADLYVNDAFGTAHRAHASTSGVTRYMKKSAAGFLIMKELKYLGGALKSPESPFVAILGGAKISGKIDVIANLLSKVDRLLIGGGMAFTFFKAKGFGIGNSLLEKDKVELARTLLEKGGDKILLPIDCMISDAFDFQSRSVGTMKAVSSDTIPDGWIGLDIGPKSIDRFGAVIRSAKTVVWNGPMGVFELEETAKGTFKIAHIIASATEKGAVTIIGGGDSAAAAEKAGVAHQISHISTGGGASLEFLEGKTLPGVAVLTEK